MALRKIQDVNSQRIQNFTQLDDGPGTITANQFLRGNAGGTDLVFYDLFGSDNTFTGDNIFDFLGLAGSAISTTSVMNCVITTSTARQLFNLALTYTGSSSANGVVASVTWNTTSTAPSANGGIFTGNLASANTTGGTIGGVLARVGFSGTPAISAGTHVFNGLWLSWLGNGGTHTGGTVIRRMLYQESEAALSGVTNVLWGAVFNNDVQLNSGTKLILEGTDTTKGDSYIDWASNEMRFFVNGTETLTIGNNTIGFYGVAPVARSSAYTPTNVTTDRSYDANATTVDELADVLGTLIADLQSVGLLS